MWPLVFMMVFGAGPEPTPPTHTETVRGAGFEVRDPTRCLGAIATALPPGHTVTVEVAPAVESALRLIVVMRDGARPVLVRERGLAAIDCPFAARLVVAWVEAALAEAREGRASAEAGGGRASAEAGEGCASAEALEGRASAEALVQETGEFDPVGAGPAQASRRVRLVGPREVVLDGELGVDTRLGREAAIGVTLGLGVREAELRVGLGLEGAIVRTASGWDAIGVGLVLGFRWSPWRVPVGLQAELDAGARGGIGASEVGVEGVFGVRLGVVWEEAFGTPLWVSARGRWGISRASGEGTFDAGVGLGVRFGGGSRGSEARR